MFSDSQSPMPRLFFELFSSVSVKDVQNVCGLQQVITLRHSIGFQCNLVHEQTTWSPISCSKTYLTCSFRFCTILAFVKNAILQITWQVLGCKSAEFWVWIPYQTQKLASHVLFQSMA